MHETGPLIEATKRTASFFQSPDGAGIDLQDAPTCGDSEKRFAYILQVLLQKPCLGEIVIDTNYDGVQKVAARWTYVTLMDNGLWLRDSGPSTFSGYMLMKNPDLDDELAYHEDVGNRNGLFAAHGTLFLAAVVLDQTPQYRLTRPVRQHWQQRLLPVFLSSLEAYRNHTN